MTPHYEVVPLGVSGLVTVPRSRVEAAQGRRLGDDSPFLVSDVERLQWLSSRLDRQLDFPLVAPGSGAAARKILQRLPSDPLPNFAQKLLLTLRDGAMHSTVAVSGEDDPVAVCFVCWRGSWQDLIGQRYGQYLPGLLDWIGRVNDLGLSIAAFLQIDAFVQEKVDPDDPLRDLDDAIVLDVEYSCLPGSIFGTHCTNDAVPKLVLINGDLLSAEQKKSLAPLFGA
jgi:hypothetical protein